jgi:hypothetical protein
MIDLIFEIELLPPSHRHQPDLSSSSTEPQAVAIAPPPSSSVCETDQIESISTSQPSMLVKIFQ